jgi:hypothetical protein
MACHATLKAHTPNSIRIPKTPATLAGVFAFAKEVRGEAKLRGTPNGRPLITRPAQGSI